MLPRDFLDLYAVLGVSPTATDEDIRRAYIERIKAVHPDTMQHLSPKAREAAEEQARLLNQAKETLLSPARRRVYDEFYQRIKRQNSSRSTSSSYNASYRSVRFTVPNRNINLGAILFGIGLAYILFASVGLVWRGVMTKGGVVRIADAEPISTLSQPFAELRTASPLRAFALSDKDPLLYILPAESNTIEAWHLETRQCVARYTLPFTANTFAVSQDGHFVASSNTQLALGKFGDSAVAPKILSAHQRSIHTLAFSPDYTRFASCALDQTIKVWNWQSQTPERSFVPSGKAILSVAYSPDGNLIAFADDRWLRTWTWKNGATRRLTLHRDKILHVCCSPTWIASASEGGEIRQTHRTTGAAKHLGQESGQITSMTYSPDYRFLVTSNADGRLRLYDTEAFRLIHTWNAHLGKALMVRFSHDGNMLYSAGEDSAIRVWQLPSQFLSISSAQSSNTLYP